MALRSVARISDGEDNCPSEVRRSAVDAMMLDWLVMRTAIDHIGGGMRDMISCDTSAIWQ